MTRLVVLALIAAATACGGGVQRVGSQPSWRAQGADAGELGEPAAASLPAERRAMTFTPTSEPAARYNEPSKAAPPSSPLADAVVAAVRDAAAAAKLPAPVADARLFRACAELAELAPDNGTPEVPLIDFVLHRQGLIEPVPRMLVLWAPLDDVDAVLAQLRPQLPEILSEGVRGRVGVGVAKRRADGSGAFVFAFQSIGLSTSPIPRSVSAGGSFGIDAVVESGYRDPEVLVTREDGRTDRVAIQAGKRGAFRASILCGAHVGKQQIEIAATGPTGSTALANFPVWCGAEPPSSVTVEPAVASEDATTAPEIEKQLFALINRDRRAAGLPALAWDDRVAAVSRAYSDEMRRTKVVAHQSPTSGAAADRVRAGGIKTGVVLENIARAYGAGEAHAGLMNSPGHRMNILSTMATHVGIGVVLESDGSARPTLYVTEVFIRVPPKVDRAQAADLVRARIDQVRKVGVDPALQKIAQQLADGLAAGKSHDAMWPGVKKQLDTVPTAYARVGSVVSVAAELSAVDGKGLVGDAKPDMIGVGIAQGNHAEIGEGAIWIVVLMAERPPAKP